MKNISHSFTFKETPSSVSPRPLRAPTTQEADLLWSVHSCTGGPVTKISLAHWSFQQHKCGSFTSTQSSFCQKPTKCNHLWDIYASFSLNLKCPMGSKVMWWGAEGKDTEDMRSHLCFPEELCKTHRVLLIDVRISPQSFLTHSLLTIEKNNSSSALCLRYWRVWPENQYFTCVCLQGESVCSATLEPGWLSDDVCN